MTLRPAFFHILLFILVFGFGALGLNAVLRDMDAVTFDLGRLGFKLDLYLDHYADSDIVFVGTSRTDRQIDIPHLQKEMAALGCPATAYNLGIPNLTYEEMRYVLEHVRTAKPQLIVLEEPIYAQHQIERIETDRLRAFSDWAGSANRFANIWSYQEDLSRKIYRSGVNLLAFAYEQSNLGHLSRLIFPQAHSDKDTIILPEKLRANRGFVSMDTQGEVDENIKKLKKSFTRQIKTFQEKVLVQQKGENPYQYPAKARATLMRSLREDAVILLPPLVDKVGNNANLEQELGSTHRVLNYNNPQKHPQFWSINQWYDEGHLNAKASKAFTSLIALDLCPSFRKGRL